MKQYITAQKFLTDFKYEAVNSDQIETNKIEYYIQRASMKVDTIVGGAISKGLRDGYYKLENGNLVLDETKIEVDSLAEAKDATEALYEALGLFTKFGIDTGYDFITGTFSSSVGSQSDTEQIDFEESLQNLTRTVNEMLGIYDFNTILFGVSYAVEYEDEDDNQKQGDPIVGNKKYLTEQGLVNRLTDSNWTQGKGGIKVYETVAGQPSKGITIEFTGKTGGLGWLTDDYTDLADFTNKAPDFEVVKYDIGKDGGNRKGTLLMKVPGPEVIEFITKEYVEAENGVIKADLLDVRGVADDAFLKAKANEEQIAILKRKGSYRGTYDAEADINAIQNPLNGDYASLRVPGANPGDKLQYQEYIYNELTAIWEPQGALQDLHPHATPSFLLKEIKDTPTYADGGDPATIGSINIDRTKFADIKNKDNVILDLEVSGIAPKDNSQFNIIQDDGTYEKIKFSGGDITSWDEVKDKIITHSMLLEKDGNVYYLRGWVLKPKTKLNVKKWVNITADWTTRSYIHDNNKNIKLETPYGEKLGKVNYGLGNAGFIIPDYITLYEVNTLYWYQKATGNQDVDKLFQRKHNYGLNGDKITVSTVWNSTTPTKVWIEE